MRGVVSNVPVLPAGSAATAPRDGGRGGGGDRDDSGGDKRRTEIKRQRRQEREKHAVVLDEIAPKETGRQAVAVRKTIPWEGRQTVALRLFPPQFLDSYSDLAFTFGGADARWGEGGRVPLDFIWLRVYNPRTGSCLSAITRSLGYLGGGPGLLPLLARGPLTDILELLFRRACLRWLPYCLKCRHRAFLRPRRVCFIHLAHSIIHITAVIFC